MREAYTAKHSQTIAATTAQYLVIFSSSQKGGVGQENLHYMATVITTQTHMNDLPEVAYLSHGFGSRGAAAAQKKHLLGRGVDLIKEGIQAHRPLALNR